MSAGRAGDRSAVRFSMSVRFVWGDFDVRRDGSRIPRFDQTQLLGGNGRSYSERRR